MKGKVNRQAAAQTAIAMSKILFEFGQIKRITKMPNGEYESDSHHSFTLALIAYELAKMYAPELDATKVMAYGLVHDLPEVITNDMNTLLASSEELVRKKADEKAAMPQIRKIFNEAPNVRGLIEKYETYEDEEAKFVFWLDKTMTILTHFFDDGKNLRELGIKDQPAIEQWYERLQQKLAKHAAHPHATAVEVLESLYQKMHDELLPPAGSAEPTSGDYSV
jgi:5'-deoxynucleotidase YfbR-like HD superfamily hydrolase